MLRRVDLVRIDVSAEPSAFIIRVTDNIVPISQILVPLSMEVLGSSETSVLKRSTRRHIPDGGILHSHRRENIKSYIALTGWTL
jgi:hypothetical protein